MARRDLSKRDASDHAASELEYVISSQKRSYEPTVPSVTAEQALRGKRMLKIEDNRNITRVLFISQDTELLNPTTQSLDGYINISDLFAEVHILILRPGISPKNPVLRVAPNVWMYTATAKLWWETPAAGLEMAEGQLEFASGFRPDLIVARDPFESAIVAAKLAEKYNKPSQLHIVTDYSTPEFYYSNTRNFWRLFLLRFTVAKFLSVRTTSRSMEDRLKGMFTIPNLALLPRYQNYAEMVDADVAIDLKEKYKPFIFFMVFVGYLGHESTLHTVIDSAQEVLRNPRIGFIVLGDGPARHALEKKVRALGLSEQVIFEPKVKDVLPYLKSAHILVVSDTDAESEEVVLMGAAAGISMVMSRTDKRDDIFTNAKSAFLYNQDDLSGLAGVINVLLTNIHLRESLSENGQKLIKEEFHNDPKEYAAAYRTTIEQAFFAGEVAPEPKKKKKNGER